MPPAVQGSRHRRRLLRLCAGAGGAVSSRHRGCAGGDRMGSRTAGRRRGACPESSLEATAPAAIWRQWPASRSLAFPCTRWPGSSWSTRCWICTTRAGPMRRTRQRRRSRPSACAGTGRSTRAARHAQTRAFRHCSLRPQGRGAGADHLRRDRSPAREKAKPTPESSGRAESTWSITSFAGSITASGTGVRATTRPARRPASPPIG